MTPYITLLSNPPGICIHLPDRAVYYLRDEAVAIALAYQLCDAVQVWEHGRLRGRHVQKVLQELRDLLGEVDAPQLERLLKPPVTQ